jgi:hypothetical protein
MLAVFFHARFSPTGSSQNNFFNYMYPQPRQWYQNPWILQIHWITEFWHWCLLLVFQLPNTDGFCDHSIYRAFQKCLFDCWLILPSGTFTFVTPCNIMNKTQCCKLGIPETAGQLGKIILATYNQVFMIFRQMSLELPQVSQISPVYSICYPASSYVHFNWSVLQIYFFFYCFTT